MYLRVSPYQDVLEGMSVALQVNEGIIKLTGRDGAGKSALCRELAALLTAHGQRVLQFPQAPVFAAQLQDDILAALGLHSSSNFTRQLTTHLLEQPADRRQLYMIFDQAQDIDAQTFNSIRMLCNVQDEHAALVKPIICGSSALEKKLSDITYRSVAQYLSQSFTLAPMTIEQLKDFYWAYWHQRGIQVQPPSDVVITNLFKESQGFPGPVLAKLEHAYQRVVDRREGREADEPLARPLPVKRRSPQAALAAGFGVLLLGTGAVLYYLNERVDAQAARPVVAVTPAVPAATADAPAATAPQATDVEEAAAPVAVPAEVAESAASEAVPAEVVESAEPETVPAEVAVTTEPAAALAEAEPVPTETDVASPEDQALAADETVASDLAQSSEAVVDEPAVEPASVVATEPPADTEAAVTTEPTAAAGNEAAEALLAAWTASWQTKDVEGYLGYYDPSFEPANGVSRSEWEAQRRGSIGRASDIVISWDSLELQAEDASSLTLQFWLHYSASNYADDTLKELVLLKTPAGLRIRYERNLLVERPQ